MAGGECIAANGARLRPDRELTQEELAGKAGLSRGALGEARYGPGLMVDRVAAGALTRQRAVTVARPMQASNPLHIDERVLTRFRAALGGRA